MPQFHPKTYDKKIYQKALSRALRRKDYHQAPPSRKNEMLQREYEKLLRKETREKKQV